MFSVQDPQATQSTTCGFFLPSISSQTGKAAVVSLAVSGIALTVFGGLYAIQPVLDDKWDHRHPTSVEAFEDITGVATLITAFTGAIWSLLLGTCAVGSRLAHHIAHRNDSHRSGWEQV